MAVLFYKEPKIEISQYYYHPKQQIVIQQLFRDIFARYEVVYEDQYAASCGGATAPVFIASATV
ncbi:MAG: hypothetical protein JW904_00600 [Spirochaetales bacterium]|nr:hypothetical protein [Spirochaetales bacterium]